ncbi:hypothetical protein RRG08_047091 [Elysia crispata]|uniref:Uncharacterized protein n=1 Tax=Elysia crispata TaxID=231223 RepID=A0AAE1AAD2_9GAST|nr:hypothetical protein RRG08_047091 [Elysia crispata]
MWANERVEHQDLIQQNCGENQSKLDCMLSTVCREFLTLAAMTGRSTLRDGGTLSGRSDGGQNRLLEPGTWNMEHHFLFRPVVFLFGSENPSLCAACDQCEPFGALPQPPWEGEAVWPRLSFAHLSRPSFLVFRGPSTHLVYRHTSGLQLNIWSTATHLVYSHTSGLQPNIWSTATHLVYSHTPSLQPHIWFTATHLVYSHTSGLQPHIWSSAQHLVYSHTPSLQPHILSTATHLVYSHTSGLQRHTWSRSML